MAQIDLKYAFVRFKDGYLVGTAPKVAHTGGYTAGDTTMLVDGIAGEIAIGDTFTVVGDTGVIHTISAHSETTGNTTSITFAPAISAGATILDDADITFTVHQILVKVGEGNCTWDETRKFKYTLDRGRLDTVRQDDEEPLSVKLEFTWEWLKGVTSSGVPTIEDVLKKRGEAAHWISSSSDPCEPYAVDIEIEYVPPCETEGTETFTLEDFRWESLAHDLKAGTVSVSGKCNVTEADVSRSGPPT